MEEIWKDIEEYKGLYQISNLGRVKSLRYNKEKIIKSFIGHNGYLFVKLYKNNECKNFRIHRLVGHVFIENPNNYKEINHIDECKTNNNVNNLEWCNRKYNINYGTGKKRRGEKIKKAIYCLETNKIYNSIKECAKELNINQISISHVLNGRQKQVKGYTFRYANQVLYIGGK